MSEREQNATPLYKYIGFRLLFAKNFFIFSPSLRPLVNYITNVAYLMSEKEDWKKMRDFPFPVEK